jgi:hypothetical protein
MTPEQQRIAIAEAYGFSECKLIQMPSHSDWSGKLSGRHTWVPDYLNDLNAMHEAEKVLSGPAYWEFVYILDDIVKHGPHVDYVASRASATAAQRAKALLRTLGK